MSALSISSISSATGCVGGEGLPQHALDDVVVDVLDALVAELAIAQAAHSVVFVQALLRLGGRLDVPLQQRHAQRLGDFLGQHRLAGAGLALDEQRALERDRRVHRQHQVLAWRRSSVSLGTSWVWGGEGGRGHGRPYNHRLIDRNWPSPDCARKMKKLFNTVCPLCRFCDRPGLIARRAPLPASHGPAAAPGAPAAAIPASPKPQAKIDDVHGLPRHHGLPGKLSRGLPRPKIAGQNAKYIAAALARLQERRPQAPDACAPSRRP